MTEPDRVSIFRVSWRDDRGNFRVKGANIAGFVKVADAMLAYGVI